MTTNIVILDCLLCLGEDEKSINTRTALESVADQVKEHAVALKLTAGSETAKQFGQVYPVLLVPSTFIIKNGIPVDIIAGEVNPEDFLAKLKKAVETDVTPAPSSVPSTSSSSPTKKKPGVIVVTGDGQLKQHLDSAGPDDLVVVDFTASWCPPCQMIAPFFEDLSYKYSKGAIFIKVDVDKCKITAGMYGVRAMPTFIFFREGSRLHDIQGANTAALENKILELIRLEPIGPVHNPYADDHASSSSSMPLEERVSLVQSKLQEVRQRKEAEEENKEIEEERSRRNVGKEMAKAKKLREEQEMKEALDQRKKDALLEKEARARVLQQIQADREERKRRFDNQSWMNQEPGESSAKKPAAGSSGSAPVSNRDFDSARIQFKFPDGSTITQEFKSRDTLKIARDFVQNNSQVGKKFSLSQTFPRKIFSEEDMNETLINLSLVPATVLLVIPESGGKSFLPSSSSSSAVSSSGYFGFLHWLLFFPFVTIWQFIRTFLPTTPPPAIPPGPSPSSSGTSAARSDPKQSSSGSELRNRKQTKDSGSKIHRLQDSKDDEDDDNNTWNGNSTQQM